MIFLNHFKMPTARYIFRFSIWQNGMPRFTRTNYLKQRASMKCGRLLNCYAARQKITGSAGTQPESEIAASCITAARILHAFPTIIFLANSWETRDMNFSRGLAAIFYPEFALPKVEPIEDKEPKTTSLVRRVLLQLSRGKANTELFTSEAKAEIFPERAKMIGELLDH